MAVQMRAYYEVTGVDIQLIANDLGPQYNIPAVWDGGEAVYFAAGGGWNGQPNALVFAEFVNTGNITGDLGDRRVHFMPTRNR